MSKRKCVNCGKDPASGYASVGRMVDGKWVESWYCHGDEDDFTCYMGSDQMPTPAESAEMTALAELMLPAYVEIMDR